MLAQLSMNMGDRAAAIEHASAVLPVLERLGASDDEIQLRALLALCAIADGRLRMRRTNSPGLTGWIAAGSRSAGTSSARSPRPNWRSSAATTPPGLRIHRECAVRMREIQLPGIPKTEMEPWALFGESMALGAHAFYATSDDVAHGQALYLSCRASALRVLAPGVRSSTIRPSGCCSPHSGPGRACAAPRPRRT